MLEKPLTLGESTIKVGDTINYTKNGTQVKGIVVNKTADKVEFMPVDNSNKAKTVGYVRLGYNEGETNSDNEKNQAIASWSNAEQLVNKEARDNYSLASRALTVEDVNRLTGFDPTTDYSSITYNKTYTTSSASGDMRFIVDDLTMVKTTDNEVLKATDLEGINVGDTVKLGNETYGGKTISEITMICTGGKSTNANYYYDNSSTYQLSKYFGSSYFWLASRCLCFSSNYGYFSVRICSSGGVNENDLYRSYGGDTNGKSRPVVPVVSLSSNILVKAGATSEEWNVNE